MRESKPKYWGKLIAEQEAGQKVRPFCRERGISEPSFYYWRKRLRQVRRCDLRYSKTLRRPWPPGLHIRTGAAEWRAVADRERRGCGDVRLVLDAVRA